MLLPVDSRVVGDHVRCFTKFQTPQNPLGAGHRRSQPAPVTHPGHRQAPQPSWGNQGKEIPERATGNSSRGRESQGGNSSRGTEGPQKGPKEGGRRGPGAGIFPWQVWRDPTGAETPLQPREGESGGKERREDWGRVVVGRICFSLCLYFSLPESILTGNKLSYYSPSQVCFAMVVTGE